MNTLSDPKQTLLARFDFASQYNDRLINDLTSYATTNNAFNLEMMQGYTFLGGLSLLERMKNEILSPENRQTIILAPEQSPEIKNLTQRLEQHIQNLSEIETHLNVHFKSHN